MMKSLIKKIIWYGEEEKKRGEGRILIDSCPFSIFLPPL